MFDFRKFVRIIEGETPHIDYYMAVYNQDGVGSRIGRVVLVPVVIVLVRDIEF